MYGRAVVGLYFFSLTILIAMERTPILPYEDLTSLERIFLNASLYGNHDIVETCLEDGVNINVQSFNHFGGNTALTLAIMMEHHDIVDTLLAQKDILPNCHNNTGHCALHYACHEQPDTIFLKKLIQKFPFSLDFKKTTDIGMNILHLLCCAEPLEQIYRCSKILLAFQRSLLEDKTRGLQSRPLHILAERKEQAPLLAKIIRFYAMMGAPIHAIDTNHDTALIIACKKGNSVTTDTLLECGAQITPNKHGLTPLHIACQKNYHHILRSLLQSKPKQILHALNYFDKHGFTPLDYAHKRQSAECLELLKPYTAVLYSLPSSRRHSIKDNHAKTQRSLSQSSKTGLRLRSRPRLGSLPYPKEPCY